MNETKLNEIITILRSIILQNQLQNIYESKMVNGLKFENNIISFTLELLPEQLKQSESIKKLKELNKDQNDSFLDIFIKSLEISERGILR